jgi:prolipoprotein diacylglyceryltransferase
MVHLIFDILGWTAAVLIGLTLRRRLASAEHPMQPFQFGAYWAVLVLGGAAGAWGFGSWNLLLSEQPGIARSILGGIAGATAAIEIYKRRAGVVGSTGGLFVVPLSIGIAVGRIGCWLSGLEDFTYGIPTMQSWGWDFGDGTPRHPVALYESVAVALFGMWALLTLRACPLTISRYGFYLFCMYYGLQRFIWEFLKPYETIVGPLNLFHVLTACLFVYGASKLVGEKRRYAQAS